ncbi:MAG: hypothetical protein K0R29_2269 [Pseudobdellovibrio sp.]|jgi:uncharacterized protein YcbX|nr:hypothetical protein [Pseudobdellovibrio sp.]
MSNGGGSETAKTETAVGPTTARITGLYIYPVKSCRGIAVNELKLTSSGPEHDREWMIVDENNKFLTLRNFPKLAEIKTSIQGPYLHLYAGTNKILVDFSQECEQVEDVTVWNSVVKAGVENKSINEALSEFLTKTVKLVRYQSQSYRDLGAGATLAVKETRFTDSRPLLLVNESSLADLNSKLAVEGKAPSEIERFRANIIVSGLSAYSEDTYSHFTVKNPAASPAGSIDLTNQKQCGRCVVITQDVETGKVVSKETLKILADERKQENSNKIPFGVYLTPSGVGTLCVGDSIECK